jgi:hypothetical protein
MVDQPHILDKVHAAGHYCVWWLLPYVRRMVMFILQNLCYGVVREGIHLLSGH